MSSEDSQKKNARKRDAVFRNQPVKKIGDFWYVLEKKADSLQYWRCRYVGCPGRCRTDHDFRVVAGPSSHLQELHDQHHSAASRGTEDCDSAGTSTAMQLDRQITGKGVREDTNGGRQETSREVPARQKQEEEQKKREKKKRKLQHEEAQREELRHQKRHHRSASPVEKQSVRATIHSDSHVSPGRLLKQAPPSPSPQASVVTHEAKAPSNSDDPKTQRHVNAHATSPGKSLPRGGPFLRPDSPVKGPIESVSPRQPCEASSTIKKEKEAYFLDCKDTSELESDDDRSTVSFEDDDNNVNEESTLGSEAEGNKVDQAVQMRAHVKVEDEGRSAGGDCKRRLRLSADYERSNTPLNAEHELSQVKANYEAKPASDGDGNRPETRASHAGESRSKADGKRSHESANHLLAERRGIEPSVLNTAQGTEHRAERPRMAHGTGDSRERELRVAVLIRMLRLLEAETELANQERCNEAVRRMLLERQLIGIKMEPSLPFK